jgi:hypothetical protein
MRDYLKDINTTPHRIEKVRKVAVKKWDISLFKLDFETERTTKAAKKRVSESNDKDYIVVYPYIEIETLRRGVQGFDSTDGGNGGDVSMIIATHTGTQSDDTPFSHIYKRVTRTAFYHAYLITVPKGEDSHVFAFWVNNYIWKSRNAKK